MPAARCNIASTAASVRPEVMTQNRQLIPAAHDGMRFKDASQHFRGLNQERLKRVAIGRNLYQGHQLSAAGMGGDGEECVAGENAGEIVDQRGSPRGPDSTLALDSVTDGAGQRGALQFGLHQNVLSSFTQQSIREVFIRLVSQNQNGSDAAHAATSRNESSSVGLSGRLRLSRTASNESRRKQSRASASRSTGTTAEERQLHHWRFLLDLEERFRDEPFVLEFVLYEQELEGFRLPARGVVRGEDFVSALAES